ncbi:MIP/aquaporin family protein [Roseibacillus persicicus]|uniref:Glycerol uptake facilitator protein n=1 Tax=Roseibacillus persicicus TaxID=454148 RepID=A0A918TSE8_9BACT|nr:MIP/aquaporin family protein [Roseibacillus persicicus]GHC60398.1 putative glycerol uptake facilitator protein [Roseibacillus persicicus]
MNPYLAEFVGTAILILLGNGVVANVVLNKSKGQNGGWMVITAGWGLAVTMAVIAVGRISGAHINPAVTVSLAVTGDFAWAQVPGFIAAQIAGGMAGATLVWLTYLAHWEETDDEGGKLACFATAPAIRKLTPAFLTEVIGTAMLVFGILSIGQIGAGVPAAELEGLEAIPTSLAGVVATWWSPLLVGLLVLAIGLSLGGPTGYAINPARDLGPRIAHQLLPIAGKGKSDWSYAWIPIAAPLIGGPLGALLYRALFPL